MIAKLERTQSNIKQNKNLTLNPHKQQQTMNNQQQIHRLRMDSSRSHWGLKLILLAKSLP